MSFSIGPEAAWLPLEPDQWTADRARHLLRRAGWSAQPDEVDRAVREGLPATLDRLFPAEAARLDKPKSIIRLDAEAPELQRQARAKTGNERRQLERDLRERERAALRDLTVDWLAFAADPSRAATAKWILFLSDVYVVSAEKVRHAGLIFNHFDILAQHAFGPAPQLTRAVLRSPAMVLYLDLNQSRRGTPNENFARELFELFVLGEGNYTEHDIKEAARAFTGYRAQPLLESFRFAPGQHDRGSKTVFGERGSFNGDDVIDLAYRQPAAAAFLPHELVKFYLSDRPLPHEYLVSLGAAWRESGFNLRTLAHRFFGGRLFHAPEFQRNMIKSPIQFQLGLLQDLNLDVSPLARMSVNPLRQMGQWLFFPPNVRGWVGGTNWINSATITARRQLVEMLFGRPNERQLNADEVAQLDAARSAGRAAFHVGDEWLGAFDARPDAAAAAALAHRFLGAPVPPELVHDLRNFIAANTHGPHGRLHALRRAAATLAQSPEYQLT